MTRKTLLWLAPPLILAAFATYLAIRPRPPAWWNPLPTDIAVEPHPYSPEADCQAFLKTLPAGYRHDWITVPENWDEPRARQIQVFYYWNAGEFSGKVPVVFFNGGPTYDSHGSFGEMESRITRYRLPFVFLDQRGTGCSTAYPREQNAATVRRLAHYGSADIVRDAEAIRKKLIGEQRWKPFGQSAGGWMVFRYLELFPNSVHSAYVHGAALNLDEVTEMVARLKSQKRVAEAYFKKYPRDLALWRGAQERVPPELCFTDGTTRLCGPGMLDALIVNLGFGSLKENSHAWIESLKDRNDAEFREWLLAFVRTFFFHTYVGTNSYAGTVLGLLESNQHTDQDLCAAAQQRLEQAGEAPQSWPLNECRMEQALERQWTDVVLTLEARNPYSLPRVAESLERHPEIALHLFASRLDSFVPVESYRETREILKHRAHYREFPGSGHEGYFTEPAIWQALQKNGTAP